MNSVDIYITAKLSLLLIDVHTVKENKTIKSKSILKALAWKVVNKDEIWYEKTKHKKKHSCKDKYQKVYQA